jgi:hypothetical protein
VKLFGSWDELVPEKVNPPRDSLGTSYSSGLTGGNALIALMQLTS